MPVLSIGEIQYMITLLKKYLTIFFFYKMLDWEIFQAILGKFRGKSGPKKTHCIGIILVIVDQ